MSTCADGGSPALAAQDSGLDQGLLARTPLAWAVERFVAALLVCGFVSLLYYPVGQLTSTRHVALASRLDALIPFIPETVWMYFPGYISLLLIGAFGVRHREIFYRTIASVALSSVVCVGFFLLMPSTMDVPRVTAPDSWTMHFLQWVQTIDVPNNTFPSQHVALSFSVVFGARVFSRPLARLILLMAVGVALATMTTKQHYWIDSPGGIAVAWLSHWLVFRSRWAGLLDRLA